MHASCLKLIYSKLTGLCSIILLVLASHSVLAAPKNAAAPPPKSGGIVKWVDEKGVTHYGDILPPQYAGQDNSQLNRQGRIVKQTSATETHDVKASREDAKLSAEQKRHDSALLAAYTTEQEFDLARDRNLQVDEAAVQGLNQRKDTVKERLAAKQKIADGFDQRKKPVPPYITQDIKEKQNEITMVDGQIAEKQKSMEETRQRFEKDKQRFIELKYGPDGPPTPAALAPVAAPAVTPAPEITKPAEVAPIAVKPTTGVVEKKSATVAPASAKPAAAPAAKTSLAAPVKPAAPTTTKPVKKIKRVVAP